MSMLVEDDGSLNLNRIYDIFDKMKAIITHSDNNLINTEFSAKNMGGIKVPCYKQYVDNIRTIMLDQYIPIPLDLIIFLLIRERKYKQTKLTISIDSETFTMVVGVTQYGVAVSLRYNSSIIDFHLSVTSAFNDTIFNIVYKTFYNPVSKSTYNMCRNKMLWIDVVDKFFLTKYLNGQVLKHILHCEYAIKVDRLIPSFFDLTVINEINISREEAKIYFDNAWQFTDTSKRQIYELDVSIRISFDENKIKIVPNYILEDNAVFNDDNVPKLDNITIYGINHVYSYVYNVFNSGLYSDEEKWRVAFKFLYHPPKCYQDFEILYKEIMLCLGHI